MGAGAHVRNLGSSKFWSNLMENRRGFLKTLGKLTAAVGITTAAATVLPAKGIGDTSGTAPKDKTPWCKDHGELPARKPITHASNVCITNRKALKGDLGVGKATAEGQRAIDAVENMRLDNARMGINPHHYFFPYDHRERALKELDPYNWRGVFKLTWDDWRPRDAGLDTVTGAWVASVRPYFSSCFENRQWYQTQSIAGHGLLQHQLEAKKHAKDLAFRQIVDHLQDVILERIKRDVKAQS